MKQQGRYMKQKPSGGGWKRALIVIACIILLFVGVAGFAYGYLSSKLNKITQAQFVEKEPDANLDALLGVFEDTEPTTMETIPTEETEPEPEEVAVDYGETGKIINIMVIGQDFREGEGHKLADTIMLFTLNKENKTLTMTSFLRDSYVKLPEHYRGHTCGWNRINTSYALGYGWFGDAGAMDMLNITIQGNYGIEIDGNIEIGLDTFEDVINLLGGLDIDLYGDELAYMNMKADEIERPRLVEGTNHVNGWYALTYVRMRHSNGQDSDIKRAARQRMVINKIIDKCKQMSIFELNTLLDTVLPTIVTNISTDDMKLYIKELLPMIFDIEIVSNQCPAEGTYWGEIKELPDGPGGVLVIDFNQNRKLMQAICEDN